MGFMDKMKAQAQQAVESAKQQTLDAVPFKVPGQSDSTPEQGPTASHWPAYAPDGVNVPLLELVSHVEGKNAKVRIFNDRIEWEKPKSVSGSKMTAAVLTGGMSAAVTGGVTSRKNAGTGIIPMKSITSVTTRRDTLLNDVVSVITSGNTIDMRVSKAEGEHLKRLILAGVSGTLGASAPVAPTLQAPAAPAEDPMAKVQQLAQLHAQGMITDEEFAAAKAKALGL